MKFSSTQAVLDLLLEGYKLSSSDLDDFIATLPEDQYLDYKNGAVTAKQTREQATLMVRQYVSGFANAEGGVLVIGVTDKKPRELAPCVPIGETSLDNWAGHILQDMAPHFSPPPRIQVVSHDKGQILVIAVARAPELVPCIETRQFKYYLRMHESTLEVPAFLITDLVLGRRQHPIIDIGCRHGQVPHYLEDRVGSANLYFWAENLGFATAEHLELGIVSWADGDRPELNPHLSSYLETEPPPQLDGVTWRLQHRTTVPFTPEITRLTPFSHVRFRGIEGLRLPFIERPVHVTAAVYLIAYGAPPIWFELEFTCSRVKAEVSRSSAPQVSDPKITRIVGRRARVTLAEC